MRLYAWDHRIYLGRTAASAVPPRASRGLDEITNYVEAIYITNLTHPNRVINFQLTPGSGGAPFRLRSLDMIALLSTPKYAPTSGDTNDVRARVKALTGPAAEKGPLTN